MITEVITFWGTVQGVGFRPRTAQLAASFGICGQVRNMGGLVQLVVTDQSKRIDEFVKLILKNKPEAADIVRMERKEIDLVRFLDFSIAKSGALADEIRIIPADIAICDSCLTEFHDAKNPRYRHPFISCTTCGPRFTIMERLPYDRETTTMDDFPMCNFCHQEYVDSDSLRYHAQTISCHDCGPQPEWVSGKAIPRQERGSGQTIARPGKEATDSAIAALRSGGVIALKGTGGYYFTASPFLPEAVQRIRAIKNREEKPFAVQFRNMDEIRTYCRVGPEEEALLTSPKRPIVLLEQLNPGQAIPPGACGPICHAGRQAKPLDAGVCNLSRFIGAFLPSMGLQHLLLEAVGPLIMTSANLSDLPITTDDAEMKALLLREERLDGILYNRRRIVVGVDDSVARVVDGVPQLVRRSKGYTPVPVYVQGMEHLSRADQIFATGGQLKSAFALSKGSFSYLSQFLGDLFSVEAETLYRDTFRRMKDFFGISPTLVVCDLHPGYFTTGFAESCVQEQRDGTPANGAGFLKLLKVQHHHAHIASVMAEHGLTGPVIGVSFDGTGYGTDGKIWGGEILICDGAKFRRFSHLRSVKMIGGDSSMKEGWKSALAHLIARARTDWNGRIRAGVAGDPGAEACIKGDPGAEAGVGGDPGAEACIKGDPDAEICPGIESGADEKPKEFDIDLSDVIQYSEENDILSGFARREWVESAIEAGIHTVETSSMGRLFDGVASLLGIHHINRYEGECAILLENAADRAMKQPGANRGDDLALRFHRRVAQAILNQCQAARRETQIDRIALSGGVFQNRILMEEALRLLRTNGFTVYYNIASPPNDGGLALGQNYIGMAYLADLKGKGY